MSLTSLKVDVLVVGGGTAGAAAAWQAARMGASVLVLEESPWLGGMITAAGVSALDGNKGAMASGYLRKFREAIEDYYGGRDKVFTGWISETCFEPRVAANFFAKWSAEAGVKVWHGAKVVEILVDHNRVNGAIVNHEGQTFQVNAHTTIEATEYGDVLEMAGIPYRLGRESRDETGEPDAPETPDMEVQDLTFCATLKKYEGNAPAVPAPSDYNPRDFDCSTAEIASVTDESILNHKLHSWDSFLGYALLPNDKYLLNWPFHSNDSPDTIGVFGTAEERTAALEKAKQRTLAYVHYIQNELGHPEWGLATDEYGTPDHLPFIPYIRECRRVKGVYFMVEGDVVPEPGHARARFQPDSIAVGDYYLDHHHSKAHLPPEIRLVENYPDNAPFMVPYQCLLPETIDGLIVTEKSISASHIVNGCSRLQPVVMLMGQAAGAAAALSAGRLLEPREVDVRELQSILIEERVALYPTNDVNWDHPAFGAVQRLSLRGLRFESDPMLFTPDVVLDQAVAEKWISKWAEVAGISRDTAAALWQPGMTKGDLFRAFDESGS